MRFARTFGVAAALSVTILTAFPAVSPAAHSWNGYHWARTTNTFTLKLGDNVSGQWDSYLATASVNWSQSTVLDTNILPGATTGSKCRPTTGRVEVCNGNYGRNGWLGLAQIWISGSHITAGTTKLNDTYFSTAAYNTPAWRDLVMCQEVGHTFGLGHQDENSTNPNLGSCMDYTNLPESNRQPNQHDYDMLVDIYRHTDGTTTVAASAASGQVQAVLDTPDTWGKKTDSHAGGTHETFERDLGNGTKVLTDVIWVDESLVADDKPTKDKANRD